MRQKDLGDAIGSLREAVKLNPSETLFHRELGEALFESGKRASAGKEFDQALALDPKDPAGYFWRAKLLASGGRAQQAIESLKTLSS
jgi:Tfp pilus assembly protein PilF